MEIGKPHRIDPKVVSVIEMTSLYAAWYSFVLLRQKRLNFQHKVHPARFVWGSDLYQVGQFFYQVVVLPRVPEFFPMRTVP